MQKRQIHSTSVPAQVGDLSGDRVIRYGYEVKFQCVDDPHVTAYVKWCGFDLAEVAEQALIDLIETFEKFEDPDQPKMKEIHSRLFYTKE